MNFTLTDIHPVHQLIISLMLGLLVGLQRQWAESPIAGIRTFSLISILGTTCAMLAEMFGGWVVMLGFIGSTMAMAVGQLSRNKRTTSQEHSGLVTEFAILLMYVVGVFVKVGPVWFAATLAGILAVVLQAKIELHGIVSRFSGKEINAIMRFVLISLVILPLFPNQTYGPLNVLNPHEIWLMVVLIVAISLSGYVIYKFVGGKAGVILSGILGGIISSTATTASLSRRLRGTREVVPRDALIILISWTVLYVRVFFEAILVEPKFKTIWMPLGIMFSVSIISTLWLWKRSLNNLQEMPEQHNPTELKTALFFAFLYSLILLSAAFAKEHLGSGGLTLVAVVSGITDVDAVTLSTARLVGTGKLLSEEGFRVIVMAITSNIFFKGLLTMILGGRNLFKIIFYTWISTLLTGIVLLIWR